MPNDDRSIRQGDTALVPSNIIQPPASVPDGYNQVQALKALKKLIDDRLAVLDQYLEDEIPTGQTVDGVTHTTWDRKSTPWKEVYALAYRDLIPPGKRALADELEKDLTKARTYSRFTREDSSSGSSSGQAVSQAETAETA